MSVLSDELLFLLEQECPLPTYMSEANNDIVTEEQRKVWMIIGDYFDKYKDRPKVCKECEKHDKESLTKLLKDNGSSYKNMCQVCNEGLYLLYKYIIRF